MSELVVHLAKFTVEPTDFLVECAVVIDELWLNSFDRNTLISQLGERRQQHPGRLTPPLRRDLAYRADIRDSFEMLGQHELVALPRDRALKTSRLAERRARSLRSPSPSADLLQNIAPTIMK